MRARMGNAGFVRHLTRTPLPHSCVEEATLVARACTQTHMYKLSSRTWYTRYAIDKTMQWQAKVRTASRTFVVHLVADGGSKTCIIAG